LLLFVDTGLAGGGVTLADQAGEGVGGGGQMRVVPFMVEKLSLGESAERNARGLFAGPFPLEDFFGFRIGGQIAHGFFRSYAVTFDFTGLRLLLKRQG
jgi:hypothetical protein